MKFPHTLSIIGWQGILSLSNLYCSVELSKFEWWSSSEDDGHILLYDIDSGDTHILGADAFEIFLLMAEKNVSFDILVTKCQDRLPDQDALLLSRYLDETLANLASLGLIRRLGYQL